MEKIGAKEKIDVVSVLTEAQGLANELKRELHSPTHYELKKKQICDSLLEQILSHYDRAAGMLHRVVLLGNAAAEEGLDQSSMDQPDVHVSKKRKTLPKWSEQVRVETGFDGQLDDGYNWRKYGQKVILGANHPRAYYRCTHRDTQGCLATKLVQRTDNDPALFEVSYRGKHSCIQERNKLHKKDNSIQPRVKPENNHAFMGQDSMGTMYIPGSGQGSFATSESYISPSYGLPDLEFDCGEILSNATPIPNIPLEDWDLSIGAELDFNLFQFLDAFK